LFLVKSLDRRKIFSPVLDDDVEVVSVFLDVEGEGELHGLEVLGGMFHGLGREVSPEREKKEYFKKKLISSLKMMGPGNEPRKYRGKIPGKNTGKNTRKIRDEENTLLYIKKPQKKFRTKFFRKDWYIGLYSVIMGLKGSMKNSFFPNSTSLAMFWMIFAIRRSLRRS
jgi:hypothetical protein